MPVTEFGQVARQMPRAYRMVSAGDGVFDVAYHGVDPGKLRLGDALWTAARDYADMFAARFGNRRKTGQAVRNDSAARV